MRDGQERVTREQLAGEALYILKNLRDNKSGGRSNKLADVKTTLEPSVTLEFDNYFFFLRKYNFIEMDREACLQLTGEGEKVLDGTLRERFGDAVGEYFASRLGADADDSTRVRAVPPPPPPPHEAPAPIRLQVQAEPVHESAIESAQSLEAGEGSPFDPPPPPPPPTRKGRGHKAPTSPEMESPVHQQPQASRDAESARLATRREHCRSPAMERVEGPEARRLQVCSTVSDRAVFHRLYLPGAKAGH